MAELADPTLSASVQIFLDGPTGRGTILGTASANLASANRPSPDNSHGFQYRLIDPRLYDDQDQSIWIYGVDNTGALFSLYGSPALFHCGKNASIFVSQSILPAQIVVGTSYPMTIEFQNTGTRTWLKYPQDGDHRLGTQAPQDNANWGLPRVELPQEVPPGATVTLQFMVTPQRVGHFDGMGEIR